MCIKCQIDPLIYFLCTAKYQFLSSSVFSDLGPKFPLVLIIASRHRYRGCRGSSIKSTKIVSRTCVCRKATAKLYGSIIIFMEFYDNDNLYGTNHNEVRTPVDGK